MASITSTQQRLLRYVDSQLLEANKPWTAPIYCSVAFSDNPKLLDLSQLNFQQQNIVEYMKSPMQLANHKGKVYFNPTMYPVTKLDQLALDLTQSAQEQGFEIIRNGCNSYASNKSAIPGFPIRFRCSCMRTTRKKSSNKGSSPSHYRLASFHNDRAKNCRVDGKRKSHKSEAKLPSDSSSICRFGFQLLADSLGIYVKSGFGNGYHSHHPRQCPKKERQCPWLLPCRET